LQKASAEKISPIRNTNNNIYTRSNQQEYRQFYINTNVGG
jgi:hypothetical protein